VKLLIHAETRAIRDASNEGVWPPFEGMAVVEIPGDADTYPWPNGAPSRCRVTASGDAVEPDPAWSPPPVGRGFAQAMIAMLDGDTLPAKVERAAECLSGDIALHGILHILDRDEPLDPGVVALVQRLYVRVHRLSVGERARIEAVAPRYGVALVP
jgi:hypothetical protein